MLEISDFLGSGKAEALTSADLQSILGLNGAQIRRLVHLERLSGVPIISDETGYYIAGSPAEKTEFVHSMRHRARAILKAARAVEQGERT